ncbi:NERD domain-containing protein, partial [Staphylococcus shinii]|uniref:NERD domain-containing protein n=1 Tax=Staphylococcus shinii TaxID=2912228 RepID=UPI000FF11CB7
MIPSYELQDIDFNGSRGEAILFKEFSELGNEYTIFHSVEWLDKKGNKVNAGEADFLIFNKDYGFISLEVKHGGIIGKEGELLQINRKTNVKKPIKPMRQADNTTYKIRTLINHLNI